MQIEKFITDYASYQKQLIQNNKLMRVEIKQEAIKIIDNALKARESNLITVDKTINNILNCFK